MTTAPTKLISILLALALVAAACSGDNDEPAAADAPPASPSPVPTPRSFPAAPLDVADGDLPPAADEAIRGVLNSLELGFGAEPFAAIAEAGDVRAAWFLSDLLRFVQGTPQSEPMVAAAEALTGQTLDRQRSWGALTDLLIAWDLPDYPGYREHKGALFTATDPRWSFVFADPDAAIDYRLLSWGGVPIDDRQLGDPERCPTGCIPALDDPALTPADEGGWYPDDAVVFGIEIDGETVAFPRNIMEVHEMVNMTIGGRRLGIPYCTLCGSAQAFFTDVVPGEVDGVDRPPVLRTSGLLSRSNKVMYDLDSRSVFDTFTGEAVNGPLREAGVVLPQATVVTTTWADWRETHPTTRIVAEDGGIGRSYDLDPLRGRDDDGPIFPIGNADDRLPVQEQVVGVITADGTPVGFPAAAAREALAAGEEVEAEGITLVAVGDGLAAEVDGDAIASHQAFWFAWSQFHPDTELWMP
ncbi:MAG: DUF3179 domain-containing (seleno)protein [Acidimicrobiales bacterium]